MGLKQVCVSRMPTLSAAAHTIFRRWGWSAAVLIGFSSWSGLICAFFAVRWRLIEGDATAPPRIFPPNPYSTTLLRHRFVDDDVIVVFGGLLNCAVLLLTAWMGVWLGRRCPLRLAPVGRSHGEPDEQRRMAAVWLDLLRRAKPRWRWWVTLAILWSFVGTWVGLTADTLLYHWRAEAMLISGLVTLPDPPARIMGLWGQADGPWICLGTAAISFASVVLPARRQLIFDRAAWTRWCRGCGYPSADTAPPRPCPECGGVW
ncbi:MAG: hypothetical protein IBJ11_11380 [Phycisphaerales bacterium]|nr:hypothetical protein [Phycisphaerales bacterium]